MHHLNPFRRAHGSSQEPPPYDQQQDHKPSRDDKQDLQSDLDQGQPTTYSNEAAGSSADPPPYHAWMQVPDNASLPPPPSLGYEISPTANATNDSAEQAIAWCQTYPLYAPRPLTGSEIESLQAGDVGLWKAPNVPAKITSSRPGTYRIQSRSGCQDSSIVTNLPLFSTYAQQSQQGPCVIYYEIKVIRMGGDASSHSADEADAGIALGFAAPPYPPFRLPGWERASLGVHGDDGRRYVNNNAGGKDFTTSFGDGEVIGIGMAFRPHSFGRQGCKVEVFLTRDGQRSGSWDLDEEGDGTYDGEIDGLEGSRDLMGIVGFFALVDFEVRFRRDEWLFRP